MTEARRLAIERLNAEMAGQGLRALGFADRELDADSGDQDKKT